MAQTFNIRVSIDVCLERIDYMVNDSLINTNYLYKSQVVELTIDASGSAFKKPLRLTEVFSETFGNDYPTDDLVFSKLAYPIETFLRTTNQIKNDEDRFLIEDFINTYIKDLSWNVSPYSRKPYDFVSFKYDHASGSGVELSTADNSVKILMTYKIKEVWNSSTRDGEIVEKKPVDKKMFSKSKETATTEASNNIVNVYNGYGNGGSLNVDEKIKRAINQVLLAPEGLKNNTIIPLLTNKTSPIRKEAIEILGGVGKQMAERVMDYYRDTLEKSEDKNLDMLIKFSLFLENLHPAQNIGNYFQSHLKIDTKHLYDERFATRVILEAMKTVANTIDVGAVDAEVASDDFAGRIKKIVAKVIQKPESSGVSDTDSIHDNVGDELRNASRQLGTWDSIMEGLTKNKSTTRSLDAVLKHSLDLISGVKIGHTRWKNLYSSMKPNVRNIIALTTLLYTQELPMKELVGSMFYTDNGEKHKNVMPEFVAVIPEITHLILMTLYLLENSLWFNFMFSNWTGFRAAVLSELESDSYGTIKNKEDAIKTLTQEVDARLKNITGKVTLDNYVGGIMNTAAEMSMTSISLYRNYFIKTLSENEYFIPYSMVEYNDIASNLINSAMAQEPSVTGATRANSERWSLLLHALDTQYGTIKSAERNNNKSIAMSNTEEDNDIIEKIKKVLGEDNQFLVAELFSANGKNGNAKRMFNNKLISNVGVQLAQKDVGAGGTLGVNNGGDYSVIVDVRNVLLGILIQALSGKYGDDKNNIVKQNAERSGIDLPTLLEDFIRRYIVNVTAVDPKEVVSLGDIVLHGQMGFLQTLMSGIEGTLVKASEVIEIENERVFQVRFTQPNFFGLGSCENIPLQYTNIKPGKVVKILRETQATTGGDTTRVFAEERDFRGNPTGNYIYTPSSEGNIESVFEKKFLNSCAPGLLTNDSEYVFVIDLLQNGAGKGFTSNEMNWDEQFGIRVSLTLSNGTYPEDGKIRIPLKSFGERFANSVISLVVSGRDLAWGHVSGLYHSIEKMRKTHTIETIAKQPPQSYQTEDAQEMLNTESSAAGNSAFVPEIIGIHSVSPWSYVATAIDEKANIKPRKGSKTSKAKKVVSRDNIEEVESKRKVK